MARVQVGSAPGAGECFSESYVEARAKFIEAASAVKAELHSLKICEDESGTYTTDIAIVRGSGPSLVVVTSGTHGVEGYAGSAIQISLLTQMKSTPFGADEVNPPTVVLIHAVNPYGMAHFRRWNENNVDLNRNALLPHHFEKLINEDRLEATYSSFDSLFNPTRVPGWFYRNIGIWWDLVTNVARHGLVALKTALVAASYRHSEGVFYGGQRLEASHALLRDFMTKHFSTVNASSVAWTDVHTGLGPCGVDVLLGSNKYAKELNELFPKCPGTFDGFQGRSFGISTDEVVALRCQGVQTNKRSGPVTQSAGYEFSVGIMSDEWITQFFKAESGTALVVTQEFGTLGNLSVARALMLENAGYHYDRENHEYWRTFTRDAFYVRTAGWKKRVLARGDDVFRKMIGRNEISSPTRPLL